MNALSVSRWLRVCPAVFLALAAHRAGAARGDDEPAVLLRKAVGEVLAICDAPGATPASVRDGVRPLLEKYFDTALLTRRAIGPGWRALTPAQQQRAASLFPDLALGTYIDNLKPGLHPSISYRATVELAPNLREVPMSMTTSEGQPVEAAFRFEHTADGWKIYDIVIEGVSLLANYRSQFDPIYQGSGADGVLRALEAKTAETRAKP